MKTKEELLKAAHERLTHLKEWLSRTKSAQEKVPDVQDMVERTQWEIQMLSDLPKEGQEFIPPGLIIGYERGNEHLLDNLPLPPKYYVSAVNSTASVTTSGSTDMYSIVSRAGEVEENEFQEWSGIHKASYRQIQEKQARFEKVKGFLQRLNPDRVEELETARKSYLTAVADVGESIAAGIAMRNLLEHFKGDLFEKARQRPKENITWERMADMLAINGVGSIEHSVLIKQKLEWSLLQHRLSDVAKGQKHGLVADLENIWVKLTDHLFTVLGIVEIESIE